MDEPRIREPLAVIQPQPLPPGLVSARRIPARLTAGQVRERVLRRAIAAHGRSSYDATPRLRETAASQAFLRNLEFDYHARGLARFLGIAEDAYFEFSGLLRKLPEQISRKAVSGARALPAQAEVLYVDRPDPSMNPIAFLDKYWGRYMAEPGLLFQDDLGRLDPQLIPNIRSYCQRMAKRDPLNAHHYVAKDHLPPARARLPKAEFATGELSPVEQAIEARKAAQRERTARHRAKRAQEKI